MNIEQAKNLIGLEAQYRNYKGIITDVSQVEDKILVYFDGMILSWDIVTIKGKPIKKSN